MRNDLINDILTEENMSDKIIDMDFTSLYPSKIEFSDEFYTDIVRERRNDIIRERRNDIIDDILIDTQSEDKKE